MRTVVNAIIVLNIVIQIISIIIVTIAINVIVANCTPRRHYRHYVPSHRQSLLNRG